MICCLNYPDNNSFDEFFNTCQSTFDQHAPRKQKYARGNHMPFMTKTLSKEIMKRTKLRNKFLKERTDESKKRYALQRHYCVSLLTIHITTTLLRFTIKKDKEKLL